jgi:hypothetical protein
MLSGGLQPRNMVPWSMRFGVPGSLRISYNRSFLKRLWFGIHSFRLLMVGKNCTRRLQMWWPPYGNLQLRDPGHYSRWARRPSTVKPQSWRFGHVSTSNDNREFDISNFISARLLLSWCVQSPSSSLLAGENDDSRFSINFCSLEWWPVNLPFLHFWGVALASHRVSYTVLQYNFQQYYVWFFSADDPLPNCTQRWLSSENIQNNNSGTL